MTNCQKCQETSCAKQVSKQKLTVLTCTAYKAKKVNMTQKEPKENKLFESVEQLSKIAQDLVRRKTELSQPEQEPVAWMWDVNNGAGYSSKGVGLHQTDIQFAKHTPLYTTSPQRTWVDLTRKEFAEILCDDRWRNRPELMMLQVQAKLKEKNT